MSIHFITTLAQHVENDQNYEAREKQYMYSLSRIFSYKLPVYGVLSEISEKQFLPKDFYPFAKLLKLHSTTELFGAQITKSQKEFYSIKSLLTFLNLKDDDWIIKVSGRYMVYNDNLMNILKTVDSNKKAVIRTCDNDTQMYTFLFALRFKYFKDFFTNYDLSDKFNLEMVMLHYICSNINNNDIQYVDDLGILCNIADCNVFTYF